MSSLALAQDSVEPRKNVFQKIDQVFSGIFKKKDRTKKEAKKEPVKKQETPLPDIQPKTPADPRIDSLTVNMSPRYYQKRSSPVLNIGMIYYGDYYTEEEFARVQELLEKRFELATNSLLKLNVIFSAILPFKQKIANFPDYKQDHVTDIERLQRLWYYDNMGMKVVSEIYNEAKSHNLYGKDFAKIDALAVVTGAQFDGLGFASGRIAITENPMEIAWGLEGGGRVELQSDAKVVDELIHELGHTLHIGHAADQCFKPGMSYQDTQACCEVSPNKNDVQSYCRKRAEVDENFFYGFEACNLKNIEEIVIPAMLSGSNWDQQMTKCE